MANIYPNPVPKSRLSPVIYARLERPEGAHFIGGSGLYWPYVSIEAFINQSAPALFDLPALKQLDALGLREEFDRGITPFQVPETFANKPVFKRL